MIERPAEHGDRDALFVLHRATMRDVVAATWGVWDDGFQQALWDRHWAERHLDMTVLCKDDAIIGMYELGEDDDGERFLDLIEIAPAWQGRGLGTAIVERLLDDGPLTLSVLRANPRARALYYRLGFEVIRETELRIRMRADPRARRDGGSDGPARGAAPGSA